MFQLHNVLHYPLGLLLYFLCCSSVVSYAQSTHPVLKDAFGRTLLLHGLNTSSSAKHSTDNHPWIGEEDVQREQTEFGFNSVRYLIFWGAIEPEQDVYNDSYLAEVKKRVEWYTNRKMYVILDMHQDIYGFGVGGNGAPAWASTQTKIQNIIPDKWAWWLQNLEPKVKKSYVTFFKYKKRKELQDHYMLAWKKVIEVFKDNPYVIGYDVMNEPHGGKVIRTLSGKFEKKELHAFYKRVIGSIRTADTTRYIFFEPRSFGVNFGMKSHLPKVEDAIPSGTNKLVYAPHLYLAFVDIGGNYSKKYQKKLVKWYRNRLREAAMHQTPILIGEFGLSPGKKDFDKYLQDIFKRANQHNVSWSYWSSDLGGWGPFKSDKTPSPIMNEIVAVYPHATAGLLKNFEYDKHQNIFQLAYVSDSSIAAPTEIIIPKFLFPNGYDFQLTGLENWRQEFDSTSQTLKIYTNEGGKEVAVFIKPKSAQNDM